MPRYAMIKPPFDGWEVVLPNAKVESFEEDEVLSLDSLTFTDQERKALKKRKIPVRCPLCQEEVYFKRGFKRRGEDVVPHWVHKHNRGSDCYTSEGVAHALTKRFLFGKLAERGYKVKEERIHKIGDRYVRADVAVLEEKRDGEVLKLVVEVQASNMRIAEAKKRMAVYYQEEAPVAWVLLLDQLFYAYSIVGGEDEIEPDKEYFFGIAGTDVPLFHFLMDTYQYVVAIRKDGRVLCIRRDPGAARRRAEALVENREWSIEEDAFRASIIDDNKIADVLLHTPLIPTEYVPVESKAGKKDSFSGRDCEYVPWEAGRRDNTVIDFESGRTTGNTLDTLALIRETWEAAKKGQEEAKKKIEERKKRERIEAEKRRRRKEDETDWMEDWEIRFDDQEPLEITEGELSFSDQLREEESEQSFEEERRSRLINQPLTPFIAEERRKIREEGMRRLKEKQHLEEEWKRQQERLEKWKREDAQAWERALWDERLDEVTFQRVFLIRESIWQEYLKVPKDKRAEWERETFRNEKLPIWFTRRKMKLESKEYKEMKKQMRKLRRQEKKQEELKRSDHEQLNLFSDWRWPG